MPPRRTRRPRRLVKLEDVATCVGSRVDIIAVVNDVGLPKITRGTGNFFFWVLLPMLIVGWLIIEWFRESVFFSINGFRVYINAYPSFQSILFADLVCTIRVIDETKYQTGTTINLFLQNAQAFPCFEAAGDIIQLCNVKVQLFVFITHFHVSKMCIFSFVPHKLAFTLMHCIPQKDVNLIIFKFFLTFPY
jgi:hypothetical protein